MRSPIKFFSAILLSAVLLCDARGEQTNSAPPAPITAIYRTVTPSITLSNISPIVYFRGILGMTPAQREKVLAGKTPEERQAILEKVREYEALSREVREERLRQTELHWRLINLMRLKPAERDRNLKEISPLYVPMVMEQLRQWDELPESTRKTLLDNQKFIRTYVDWQMRPPVDQDEIVKKLSPQRRAYFAEELKRWQALPEDQRTELCAQFRRFFGEEQTNTIQTLSEGQRRQMDQALQAFKALPNAQRQRCIESFDKFATMNPSERAQFLQNAAKWEAMSAHEKELWNTMVADLPLTPPLPPGMLPLPPSPGLESAPSPGETGR